MKNLANALELNPEYLISALAKQEPPFMDDFIRSTAEEDFEELVDMNNSSLTEFDVFTMAANFVNYTRPLTELDIEKMKLALKVALSSVDEN